jgi:hypothetical protein
MPTGVAQHGHREKVLTSATIKLLRIIAIELGHVVRSSAAEPSDRSHILGTASFFSNREA